MADADVLIVGAGPTGLVLALWLARRGVRVRIVDKTAEPGTTSRAVAVQARTLEFYAQLGFAGEVVAHGRRMSAANLWVGGSHAARAVLGDMGAGISPFPYALIYPQDEHERLLIAHLARQGVEVERRTELAGFEEAGDRIIACLKRHGGADETCAVAYIAGCDGAHSAVRETLRIGFPGGTYEHLFYVADVDARGPAINGEINVLLERADFLAVFPLTRDGHARLIGTVRDDMRVRQAGSETRDPDLTWDDVSRTAIERMHIEIASVNWFSTYRVHHRVADAFQKGRAFLAGDAAHIHSPVGGQGMNTGIGDSVNLAWKLAAVVRGEAGASILDSYEPERIAFARRLVETTDRAFTGVVSSGPLARFIRMRVVPALLPSAFALAPVRRLMFRTVSQTAIAYRDSPLSAGQAGSVHGGDRLPWLQSNGFDNFAPLTSLDLQAHVYGDASEALVSCCRTHDLPLHLFPWSGSAARAGFHRGALYLVRPDGYVALAEEDGRGRALENYLAAHKLAPCVSR